MSGYEDTRLKIISTLMGRPNGTQIQPDKHQDYALSLLDYVRRVELISSSTLVGVAQPDTVPVQPDTARVTYLAGVAQDRTTQFTNFIGQDGLPITISNGEMEASLVILMWNMEYWSAEAVPTNIISSAAQADFFYSLQIRKTYASVSDMNADVDVPIGNDNKKIRVGEVVSVHNETTPSEDAIYSWERDENGDPRWQLQMKLYALDSRIIDGGRADTQYGGSREIDCGNAQG